MKHFVHAYIVFVVGATAVFVTACGDDDDDSPTDTTPSVDDDDASSSSDDDDATAADDDDDATSADDDDDGPPRYRWRLLDDSPALINSPSHIALNPATGAIHAASPIDNCECLDPSEQSDSECGANCCELRFPESSWSLQLFADESGWTDLDVVTTSQEVDVAGGASLDYLSEFAMLTLSPDPALGGFHAWGKFSQMLQALPEGLPATLPAQGASTMLQLDTTASVVFSLHPDGDRGSEFRGWLTLEQGWREIPFSAGPDSLTAQPGPLMAYAFVAHGARYPIMAIYPYGGGAEFSGQIDILDVDEGVIVSVLEPDAVKLGVSHIVVAAASHPKTGEFIAITGSKGEDDISLSWHHVANDLDGWRLWRNQGQPMPPVLEGADRQPGRSDGFHLVRDEKNERLLLVAHNERRDVNGEWCRPHKPEHFLTEVWELTFE